MQTSYLHMRPALSPLIRTVTLLYSSLTLFPHSLLRWLRQFSSLSAQKPKWNSNTIFTITNPTLLVMESCNTMSELKQIQAHMTRTGLIFDLFPASRVLSFCALAECGDIRHARVLFSQIKEPNTYIWNTMMRGFSKFRFPAMGFALYRRMVRECVDMDNRSYLFALKTCEQFRRLLEGESVHCRVCKVGFEFNLLVRNGLIHFYAERGCLSFARRVFDESLVRDVVSWTAMIDGYVQKLLSEEAIQLFDLMLSNGIEPNEVTMIAVLSACSQKGNFSLGKSIHEYIEKNNLNCTINLMNAMLDMYIKCGSLSIAREIFDNMDTKDVFSWTSMINGYAKHGELGSAREFFDAMPERNVVSWNAMIAGYSQNNQPKEALELFHDMVEFGLIPVESTLVCVLSACAQSGCLDFGLWIHNYYVKQRQAQLSVILGNAFIDMYAKCGCIDKSAEVFYVMHERDLASWNTMIIGYATHGHAEQALILFEQMKGLGIKPDDITFVGILSACSHRGLVSEGQEHFRSMERNFGLEPKLEHYACMIDLLGRVGLLVEAYELIMKMPMEPDEAAWGALLNACRLHGDVELGKLAANKLLLLDPTDSGIYVLLANICAKWRRWDDVRMVRSMMRERGIKKTPGRSLVELEGEFHEFLVADESHPYCGQIYKVLDELIMLSTLEEYTESMNFHEDSDSFFV